MEVEGGEYDGEEIREDSYRDKGGPDGRGSGEGEKCGGGLALLVAGLGILPSGGGDDIICGLQSLGDVSAHFFL